MRWRERRDWDGGPAALMHGTSLSTLSVTELAEGVAQLSSLVTELAEGVAQLSSLVTELGEGVAQHLQPQVGPREDALRVELHGRHRQRHVLHGHDDTVRL